MDGLDGNAIAGTLFAVFGEEMTTASTVCAHCGRTSLVGELRTYLRAPGLVVRCPGCQGVLMVLVDVRGRTSVDLCGLTALEPVR